jgi:diaminohydroxyphosphoribosylaminopyrimidine deaminase/5-amino-6-(5-phosphoribosylamino)uracil reductase
MTKIPLVNDTQNMALALKLAKKGRFGVGENPMVGCVIVRNNIVISEGYHQKLGKNHAEINALEKINFNAKDCDVFITLEPCSHTGKTPPCVEALIRSQPKRVIIASLDTNPKVNSVQLLKNAGIEVVTKILESEAKTLNRGFFKRMATGLPFVTCKIASSLDGKTALQSGESKWITGQAARADVQILRAKNQAVITGSGTVLLDNPHLNVRNKNLPSPIKIIMDRNQKITDLSLNIFQGKRTIVSDKTPLEVLKMLGDMGINYALIEAGSRLSGAFFRKNLIDELILYQAPIMMGSSAKSMLNIKIETMNNSLPLNIKNISRVGVDIKIIAQPT